jgi:hypothetical protein
MQEGSPPICAGGLLALAVGTGLQAMQ